MNKFKHEKYINQRQLKSGLWTFFVQIYTDNKPIRKNFCEDEYGSPRAAYDAAVSFKYEVLNQLREGSYIAKQNKTIEDVLNENYELEITSKETKRKHEMILNNNIDRNIKIQELTSDDIQISLNSMIYDYYDNTIQRTYSLWKRIIRTAIGKEYINKDLMFNVKIPKSKKIAKKKESFVVNKETVLKAVKDIENSKLENHKKEIFKDFILCSYYTGCRPCELIALTKDDIDYKKKIIYINKQIGSNENEFNVETITKTPTSNRIFPLNNELEKIFKKLCKISKSDYLFSDENGNRYKISQFGVFLNHLCKGKDYKLTLYKLRHLFSTDLNNKGIDARTHQELMGHANYSMSVNYANSTLEQKLDAIKNR